MKRLIARALMVVLALTPCPALLGQSTNLVSPPAWLAPHFVLKWWGSVIDPAGAPVAGAMLIAFPPEASNGVVTADAGGHYEFELSMPAHAMQSPFYRQLLARDPGRNLALIQDFPAFLFPPHASGRPNLDIHLEPGITFAVTVRDTAGRPIVGAIARIRAWAGNSGEEFVPPFQADSQGHIEVPAMPRGHGFSMEILATGYGTARLIARTDETSRSRLDFPDVTLQTANLKLTGRVLEDDGQPVRGVYLLCSGRGQTNHAVRTDELGGFRIDGLTTAPVSLLVTEPVKGRSASVNANGGDSNVVIRLPLSGSRTVRPPWTE